MTSGAIEFGTIPEWVTVVAAVLTQLGSVWFLALLLAALYVFAGPGRDEIALVGGTWLAGIGVYKALKEYFAVSRPDPVAEPALLPEFAGPAFEAFVLASGYAFPSGHAVNATVVYVGLAGALAVGPRLLRYAGAASLVATVALTRVLLGVHYVADIVAGVALGVALVIGGRFLIRWLLPAPVTATFALAVGSSTAFVLLSDGDPAAFALLAATLGAFAGWQLVALGRRLAVAARPWDGVGPTVVRGSLAGAAAAPLAAAVAATGIASQHADAAVAGVGTATVVASPLLWRPGRIWRVGLALASLGAAGWVAVYHVPTAVA